MALMHAELPFCMQNQKDSTVQSSSYRIKDKKCPYPPHSPLFLNDN